MVCLDDKHNINLGEPGFPVAAVDRGKEVVVGCNSSSKVGDHDFTKAKITPSVTLVCEAWMRHFTEEVLRCAIKTQFFFNFLALIITLQS